MAHLKRSIVEVKAEDYCLAHALIIAIAKVDNDPNSTSYRDGNKIRPVVWKLLVKTGIDLFEGWEIPKLIKFQEHFRDYNITVYQSLAFEEIMFELQVVSPKRINLLYDLSRDREYNGRDGKEVYV